MDVFYLLVSCGPLLSQVFASVNSYGTTCPERVCEVQVTTQSGPVCGRVLRAENCTYYYSFRGIPYAKPPVGRRRFQAPEPPEPWKEPLYATVEGPACPQKDILYGHLPIQIRGQSEDCLYLNVHVPSSAKLNNDWRCERPRKRGFPVLVFMHGGAFYAGSGNSDIHGPEYLMCKDVIVVTFNYRLGLFGFLSLNTAKVPGNAGLRDQILALRWVKQNIQAFGGDCDDVTLMGQSAGSTSAHLLSLSKATKGLFDKIILMSCPGIPSYFSASRSYSKFVNNLFFEKVGINCSNPDEIHEELVTMPLNKIMYAMAQVQYHTGFTTFVPIVEDKFPGVTRIIDADPIELIGKGRDKNYPTLISYTTDEMEFSRYILMILNTLDRLKDNPAMVLGPRLSFSLPPGTVTQLANRVMKKYFNGPPSLQKLITLYTDLFVKYPTFKYTEWRAALGGAPLFLHQFGYESDFSIVKYGLWIDFKGAAHIEDLAYVFRCSSALGDYVSLPPHTNDDRMKVWMTNIIVNFMRCSNPTCTGDAETPWPAVTRNSVRYQYTNTTRYNLMELTPEQRDMVEFHDSIDPQCRALSKKLAKNHGTL